MYKEVRKRLSERSPLLPTEKFDGEGESWRRRHHSLICCLCTGILALLGVALLICLIYIISLYISNTTYKTGSTGLYVNGTELTLEDIAKFSRLTEPQPEGAACVDARSKELGKCASFDTCKEASYSYNVDKIAPTICSNDSTTLVVCCRDDVAPLLSEGSKCYDDTSGDEGTCRLLSECESAYNDWRENETKPTICSNKNALVVCCQDKGLKGESENISLKGAAYKEFAQSLEGVENSANATSVESSDTATNDDAESDCKLLVDCKKAYSDWKNNGIEPETCENHEDPLVVNCTSDSDTVVEETPTDDTDEDYNLEEYKQWIANYEGIPCIKKHLSGIGVCTILSDCPEPYQSQKTSDALSVCSNFYGHIMACCDGSRNKEVNKTFTVWKNYNEQGNDKNKEDNLVEESNKSEESEEDDVNKHNINETNENKENNVSEGESKESESEEDKHNINELNKNQEDNITDESKQSDEDDDNKHNKTEETEESTKSGESEEDDGNHDDADDDDFLTNYETKGHYYYLPSENEKTLSEPEYIAKIVNQVSRSVDRLDTKNYRVGKKHHDNSKTYKHHKTGDYETSYEHFPGHYRNSHQAENNKEKYVYESQYPKEKEFNKYNSPIKIFHDKNNNLLVKSEEEVTSCIDDYSGTIGFCANVMECSSALIQWRETGKRPTSCKSNDSKLKVCCIQPAEIYISIETYFINLENLKDISEFIKRDIQFNVHTLKIILNKAVNKYLPNYLGKLKSEIKYEILGDIYKHLSDLENDIFDKINHDMSMNFYSLENVRCAIKEELVRQYGHLKYIVEKSINDKIPRNSRNKIDFRKKIRNDVRKPINDWKDSIDRIVNESMNMNLDNLNHITDAVQFDLRDNVNKLNNWVNETLEKNIPHSLEEPLKNTIQDKIYVNNNKILDDWHNKLNKSLENEISVDLPNLNNITHSINDNFNYTIDILQDKINKSINENIPDSLQSQKVNITNKLYKNISDHLEGLKTKLNDSVNNHFSIDLNNLNNIGNSVKKQITKGLSDLKQNISNLNDDKFTSLKNKDTSIDKINDIQNSVNTSVSKAMTLNLENLNEVQKSIENNITDNIDNLQKVINNSISKYLPKKLNNDDIEISNKFDNKLKNQFKNWKKTVFQTVSNSISDNVNDTNKINNEIKKKVDTKIDKLYDITNKTISENLPEHIGNWAKNSILKINGEVNSKLNTWKKEPMKSVIQASPESLHDINEGKKQFHQDIAENVNDLKEIVHKSIEKNIPNDIGSLKGTITKSIKQDLDKNVDSWMNDVNKTIDNEINIDLDSLNNMSSYLRDIIPKKVDDLKDIVDESIEQISENFPAKNKIKEEIQNITHEQVENLKNQLNDTINKGISMNLDNIKSMKNSLQEDIYKKMDGLKDSFVKNDITKSNQNTILKKIAYSNETISDSIPKAISMNLDNLNEAKRKIYNDIKNEGEILKENVVKALKENIPKDVEDFNNDRTRKNVVKNIEEWVDNPCKHNDCGISIDYANLGHINNSIHKLVNKNIDNLKTELNKSIHQYLPESVSESKRKISHDLNNKIKMWRKANNRSINRRVSMDLDNLNKMRSLLKDNIINKTENVRDGFKEAIEKHIPDSLGMEKKFLGDTMYKKFIKNVDEWNKNLNNLIDNKTSLNSNNIDDVSHLVKHDVGGKIDDIKDVVDKSLEQNIPHSLGHLKNKISKAISDDISKHLNYWKGSLKTSLSPNFSHYVRRKNNENLKRKPNVIQTNANRQSEIDSRKCTKMCKGYLKAPAVDHSQTGKLRLPNMAIIGWQSASSYNNFQCSGSLISHKHVLTTAHCLQNRFNAFAEPIPVTREIIVQLGGELNGIKISVKTVVFHPNYSPETSTSDIAIVILKETVTFNQHIKPACILNRDFGDDINTSGVIAALQTKELTFIPGQRRFPLVKIPIKVSPNFECEPNSSNKYSSHKLRYDQLCVEEVSDSSDKTLKDNVWSGVANEISSNGRVINILGLDSANKQSVNPSYKIFTKIEPYVGWIEHVVWSDDGDDNEDNEINKSGRHRSNENNESAENRHKKYYGREKINTSNENNRETEEINDSDEKHELTENEHNRNYATRKISSSDEKYEGGDRNTSDDKDAETEKNENSDEKAKATNISDENDSETKEKNSSDQKDDIEEKVTETDEENVTSKNTSNSGEEAADKVSSTSDEKDEEKEISE